MEREQSAKGGRPAASIAAYDSAQPPAEASVCRRLRAEIGRALPGATSKVWHGAPVWFVGDLPVVGYSVPAGGGVALLFWNGQAFGEPALEPRGKFVAAEARFGALSEIEVAALRRWLKKAGTQLSDVRSIRRSGRGAQASRKRGPKARAGGPGRRPARARTARG